MSEHGIITGARILCRDPKATAKDLKGALKGALNVHDELRAALIHLLNDKDTTYAVRAQRARTLL